jgi:NAD(P)-dependent dehydrogenase (short-subunit alcohol dehydrogenase family)
MPAPSIESILNFTGKVVLVTGAGHGIGKGIARRFAQAGARVAVHYHSSQEDAKALVEEIASQGGQAAVLQADLTQEEAVSQLFTRITTIFGRLDVLVNNAGNYPVTPFLGLELGEWDSVISANLRNLFLCTQTAARIMQSQVEGGVILNIASIEGSFPAFGHSHYNAAKAGVLLFTKSVARELAPFNIRINAVSPGLIGKPGIEQDWPDGVNRWKKSAPLVRLGEPEDVADACLFLASPAARWITGIDLVVDGGASTTPAF